MEITKNRYWWLVTLKGIIFIILGILSIKWPIETLLRLIHLFAATIILTGTALLITSLVNKHTDPFWSWRLAEGAIDIFFGIFLATHPDKTALMLPLMVGFWLIFIGIIQLIGSLEMKHDGYKEWWMSLLTGVLVLIVGWVITIDPFNSLEIITRFIGMALIIIGLFNLVNSLKLKVL